MKYHLTILLAVFAAGTVTARAKLNVVTTLADYAAIAREIGGDHVEITTMAKPTEDPHFVDARPSFVVKLRSAGNPIHQHPMIEPSSLPLTTVAVLGFGLLTSLHCVGMCGPIACGLGNLAKSEGERLTAATLYHGSPITNSTGSADGRDTPIR